VLAGAQDDGSALARLLATQVVVNEARLERTHLYRSFPSDSDDEQPHSIYLKEVVEYATRAEFQFLDGPLNRSASEYGLSTATPEDARRAVIELAKNQYAGSLGNPGQGMGLRAVFSLCGLSADSPTVLACLRRTYTEATDEFERFYRAILESWGCTLQSTTSPRSLAIILTALLDGMALRSLFDPEVVPPDGQFYGETVALLIGGLLTTPEAQNRPADDPYTLIRTTADKKRRSGELDGELQTQIQSVAFALFEASEAEGADPRTISVRDIASRAQCSDESVTQLWGGVSLLFVDYFYRRMETGDEALTSKLDDLTAEAEEASARPDGVIFDTFFHIVGRMLYEVAEFGCQNRGITSVALAAVEFGTTESSGSELRSARSHRLGHKSLSSRFEQVIDIGQRFGALRDETDLVAAQLGNLLPVTCLHQTVRRDGWTSRQVAEITYNTVLRGLAARPEEMPSARVATRYVSE
jgi:AcrR family transcriptional regulator